MQLLLPIFFFQAEDGIRDYKVTGVQTCALPIFVLGRATRERSASAWARASIVPASSRSAATTPVRERTTRASGTSSATDTRRRVTVAASRDANAIARYSTGPFVARLPLQQRRPPFRQAFLEVRFRDPR